MSGRYRALEGLFHKFGKCSEGFLDVGARGGRGFEKEHVVLRSESSPLFRADLANMVQIRFVANENLLYIIFDLRDLVEPVLNVLEGSDGRDVIENHDSMGSTEVASCQRPMDAKETKVRYVLEQKMEGKLLL